MLDSALLRPGRFDRQVTVDRPDVQGRVKILGVHSRGKTLGKDVDFDKVARRTPGTNPYQNCFSNCITFCALMMAILVSHRIVGNFVPCVVWHLYN